MNRIKYWLKEIITVKSQINIIYSYISCKSCSSPSLHDCDHCEYHCNIVCALSSIKQFKHNIDAIIFQYIVCSELNCTTLVMSYDYAFLCTYHFLEHNRFTIFADSDYFALYVSMDKRSAYAYNCLNNIHEPLYDMTSRCELDDCKYASSYIGNNGRSYCSKHNQNSLPKLVNTSFHVCVECNIMSKSSETTCLCNVSRCEPCTALYTWSNKNKQIKCDNCIYLIIQQNK